jgi:hypothetical protein
MARGTAALVNALADDTTDPGKIAEVLRAYGETRPTPAGSARHPVAGTCSSPRAAAPNAATAPVAARPANASQPTGAPTPPSRTHGERRRRARRDIVVA